MRIKKSFTIIFLFVIIIGLIYFISESLFNSSIPDSVTGNWENNLNVKVRYKPDGNYIFVPSDEPVTINLKINSDGKVEGNFGTAKFENCTVKNNRGWIGKKLNLATDYVIKGKLSGKIFTKDTILSKDISIPFNMENNMLSGDIFNNESFLGLYPMAEVKLMSRK